MDVKCVHPAKNPANSTSVDNVEPDLHHDFGSLTSFAGVMTSNWKALSGQTNIYTALAYRKLQRDRVWGEGGKERGKKGGRKGGREGKGGGKKGGMEGGRKGWGEAGRLEGGTGCRWKSFEGEGA